MCWKVLFRPEVEEDILGATSWYESRQAGLGEEFLGECIRVWKNLSENPFLNTRRHTSKDIRWKYPDRFPYRIIYQINEKDQTVVVLAVLHAARHDRHWLNRS